MPLNNTPPFCMSCGFGLHSHVQRGKIYSRLSGQLFRPGAEKFWSDCRRRLLHRFKLLDCPKLHGKIRRATQARAHEKNTGFGGFPRNKGIEFSRSEYVFNIGNDDLVTPIALKELYTQAKNFDADVVQCEKFYWASDEILDKRYVLLPNVIYYYRLSVASITRGKKDFSKLLIQQVKALREGIKYIDEFLSGREFFFALPRFKIHFARYVCKRNQKPQGIKKYFVAKK